MSENFMTSPDLLLLVRIVGVFYVGLTAWLLIQATRNRR